MPLPHLLVYLDYKVYRKLELMTMCFTYEINS